MKIAEHNILTLDYVKLAAKNLPAAMTDAFNHGRTLLRVIQNCADEMEQEALLTEATS